MGKSQIILNTILFFVFFIAFIIAIFSFVRQYNLKKKEHIMMIQTQHEQHQQELLATQIEIQNQTMQHIGREIHDNIGQKLTLASLYTQQLAYENKAPHINENIENISAIINQSLKELRALSKNLTDNTIDTSPITVLLEEEFQKIADLKICKVNFSSDATHLVLPYQTKSVLLRIVQEFLQNSIKYSKCKNIVGLLTKNEQSITLSIADDGIGFDVSKKSDGIGWSNIKKRTEIIGGTSSLKSSAEGTHLLISIPSI
ncbi:histidine kinase [Flavobacterium sp.]|uniref:sensor histidine kinase n=1 Tax=Flavobacterium sp. TaxID=239 RepID=UPI00261775FF|nr:histidine kinase [Flavobacterium sp.]